MKEIPQTRHLLTGALVILILGVTALIWYNADMDDKGEDARVTSGDAFYFSSPEQAVEAIRTMLKEEDWAALTRYYDLSGSGVDPATLRSGEFFIRTEPPEAYHPGGFWRYKHPFPPSFDYSFASPADDSGVVTVEMTIKIDQGAGSPMQEGRQQFRLRESASGYQVLPD